jgi:hypothetical protein
VAIAVPAVVSSNTELVAGLLQPAAAPLAGPAQAVATAGVPAPGQVPASPIDQTAFGFPGRIVFPGTGLQARSATASGPLSQQPGALLVGGSGEAAPEAPPAPTHQADHPSGGVELTHEEPQDLLFSGLV